MNEYCVVLSTTKSFHCFRIRFLSERGEQCGIVYQGWSWWIFWKWTAGNNLWDIQFMLAKLLDLSLRCKKPSIYWTVHEGAFCPFFVRWGSTKSFLELALWFSKLKVPNSCVLWWSIVFYFILFELIVILGQSVKGWVKT